MFMFLNKKVIAATFSTLFVTSRGYADTASLSTEEKIRGLDSSCSCEFSDFIGSDFSCEYDAAGVYRTYEFLNFGEEGGELKHYLDDFTIISYNFVSRSDTSATYEDSFTFVMDTTVEVDGQCVLSSSTGYWSFGCWACPPTPPTSSPTSQPSAFPTSSPTADDDCCNCCCNLFSSIQKLLLVAKVDTI